MVRILSGSVVLLATALIWSCSHSPVAQNTGEAAAGAVIRLNLGQSVSFDQGQGKLTFEEVISDDRCPRDMACATFLHGNAVIRLTLTRNGEQPVTMMDTIWGLNGLINGHYRSHHRSGYLTTVLLLSPDSPSAIDQSGYSVALQVLRREQSAMGAEPVLLSALVLADIAVNSFDLKSVTVSGDTLLPYLRHGGGCEQHFYYMFANPNGFIKTDPPQIDLYLRHYGNADLCEAYLAVTAKIDLTPLADRYRDQFGGGGELQLNVFDYLPDEPEEFHSVMYIVAD